MSGFDASIDAVSGTDAGSRAKSFCDLDLLGEIGEGHHAIVRKARKRSTGEFVAVKVILCDGKDGGRESALREIEALRHVTGDHVVGMNPDLAQVDDMLYIVLQLCPSTLASRMPCDPGCARSYARQLCAALVCVHAAGFIHRDVKPQNILIDRDGGLRLADFGVAQRVNHESPSIRGTMSYLSPELLLGCYARMPSIDMWAFGAVVLEMASGKRAFPGKGEFDQLLRIFQAMGTPSEATWPGVSRLPNWSPFFPDWPARPLPCPALCGDLVGRLLAYDPAKRPSAEDAAASVYLV
jgi:serine/threonine protein kinase